MYFCDSQKLLSPTVYQELYNLCMYEIYVFSFISPFSLYSMTKKKKKGTLLFIMDKLWHGEGKMVPGRPEQLTERTRGRSLSLGAV